MKSTDNVTEELAKKFFGLEKKEEKKRKHWRPVVDEQWHAARPHVRDFSKRAPRYDYTTLTYEKCKNICSKYNTIGELYKNHRPCWNVCNRNDWLYDFFDHGRWPNRQNKKNSTYDYEECKKIVSEYKNYTVFRKERMGLYCAILRNGDHALLDNLERTIKPPGYWTYERCKKEALKYSTIKEAAEKNGTLVQKIRGNDWRELFSHMKVLSSLKNRYIYVFEFDDNHAYVGLTWNPQIRKTAHLTYSSNKPGQRSAVKEHIEKNNSRYTFKVLTPQPLDMNEVGKVENSYIKSYEEAGWTMLNKTRGGQLGAKLGYTYKQCKDKVSEFETLADFTSNACGYYSRIKNMGWAELFDPLQTRLDYISSGKYYLDRYPKEIELLNQNKTNREIHNETGIPRCTIGHIRKKVGGPKVTPKGAVIDEKIPHKYYLDKYPKEMELLNQNKTNREIHNETGIPLNMMHRIRKKVGGPKTNCKGVVGNTNYLGEEVMAPSYYKKP